MAASSICCLMSFTAGLSYPQNRQKNIDKAFTSEEPVSDEDYPGQKHGLSGCGLDPSMGTPGWIEVNRAYLRHYPKYAKHLKERWTHLPKEAWKGIVPE